MRKKAPCTARKKLCRRCFAIFFFLENHKDIRHEREICTLEASRFNNDCRHSQCRGQAGNSLRGSTKVTKAAIDAVKLATACAVQQRSPKQPVSRSNWLQFEKFGERGK